MLFQHSISETDAAIAKLERKTDKSALVRDRLNAIYLTYLKHTPESCAQIIGCSLSTVYNYLRLYRRGGLSALKKTCYYQPESMLEAHKEAILADIAQAPPSCISALNLAIAQKYKIKLSNESVRRFMLKHGIKRRKTVIVPCGAKDPKEWQEKQDKFVENTLNPLITKSLEGKEDLLFSDACHFIQGKYERYVWSKKPINITSSHGRYRVNVVGFLDLKNKQIITQQNDTYINANEIALQLNQLREVHYKDRSRSLNIVMDNARYQHCNYVKEIAQKLNINLVFLPAYSPNLNLIERLWKEAKKKLAQSFYPTKNDFWKAIENMCLYFNSDEFITKFDTLFTPKFQRFENVQILTG